MARFEKETLLKHTVVSCISKHFQCYKEEPYKTTRTVPVRLLYMVGFNLKPWINILRVVKCTCVPVAEDHSEIDF